MSREHLRLPVEQAVGETGTGFRDFLDGLFTFFGLFSSDGQILDANQATRDLLGLGRDQIVGHRMSDLPFWSHAPEELNGRGRAQPAAAGCRVELLPTPAVAVAPGEAGEVALTVVDDGCGIDTGQLLRATSLGVVGMQERALALGGAVTVAAKPGGGTTVIATLPRTDRPWARRAS